MLILAAALAFAGPTHVHLGIAVGGPADGLTLRIDVDPSLSLDTTLGGGVGWGDSYHGVLSGSVGASMAPFGFEAFGGRFAPRLGVGVFGTYRSPVFDLPAGFGHGLYGMAVLDWRPVYPTGRMSLHTGVFVNRSLSGGETGVTPSVGIRWRLGKAGSSSQE